MRRGAYAEALAAFDRHLDAHPRDPAGRLGKSRALLSLVRYEEALAAANRALDQTSRFADAQEARGLALLGLGRDGEALACFDAALRLAGESAGLWCGIAEAPPASRQQRLLRCDADRASQRQLPWPAHGAERPNIAGAARQALVPGDILV